MDPLDRTWNKFLEDNDLGDVKICPLCGFTGRFEGFDAGSAGSGKCPECGSNGRSRLYGVQLMSMDDGESGRRVLYFNPEQSLRSVLARMPTVELRSIGLDRIADTGKRSGEFQLIVCNYLMDRVPDEAAAVAELRRILARGGVAMLSVYFAKDCLPAEKAPRRYTRESYVSMLKSNGMEVEVLTASEVCTRYMCSIMDIDPEECVVLATAGPTSLDDAAPQAEKDGPPVVSVVMPVYNASEYIRQALDSILGQTLRDIEVICVDDGSTDDSADIVRGYASRDHRVRLVEQPNGGAGKARNNALQYVRGTYVHYMDSDDWIDTSTYERISGKMASTGVDVCIFQSYTYDNVTGEIKPKVKAFRSDDFITDFESNPSFFVQNYVVPWNKLIRREVIVDNGLRYDEICCANDRSFYFALVRCARRIMVCKDQLMYHRVNNSQSLVGDNRSVNYDAHFKAFESTMSYYADADDAVKRLVMDVCMDDMLAFYDKARPKYKKTIYEQLHAFLKTVDFSAFEGHTNYEWWDRITYIRDNPRGFRQLNARERKADPQGSDYGRKGGKAAVREDVVVSLTSYPARIGTVSVTVESLLNQTVRAGRTILWLAAEQFPGGEGALPKSLLSLRRRGLEIRFCDDDLKPHKKYFYAMQEFPDSIVITADDDVVYPRDLVEVLLESYGRYPKAVSAMRVRRMTFSGGRVTQYADWGQNDNSFYRNPSMLAVATGVGGVLYPPGCIPPAAFDKEAIKATCLMADDLWLKANEVESGVPTVLAAPYRQLDYVDGTQEVSLWYQNAGEGMNDVQIQSIEGWFSSKYERTPVEIIRASHLDSGVSISFIFDCATAGTASVEAFLRLMPDWGELVCYNLSGSEASALGRRYWGARLLAIPGADARLPLFSVAGFCHGAAVIAVDPSSFSYEAPFFEAAISAVGERAGIIVDDPGMESATGSKKAAGYVFNPFSTAVPRNLITEGRFYHMGDALSVCAVASSAGVKAHRDALYLPADSRLYNESALRSVAAGLAASYADDGKPAAAEILRVFDKLRGRPGMMAGGSVYGEDSGPVRRKLCPLCGTASDHMLSAGDRLRDGVICPACGSRERHRAAELVMRYTAGTLFEPPRAMYLNFPREALGGLRRRGAVCKGVDDFENVEGVYDAIVLCHMLDRLEGRERVLEALKSKLSPNGALYLTVPMTRVGGRVNVVERIGKDVYELMEEIAGHGFETELLWAKDCFSIDTLDACSVGNEAVIVCSLRAA